MNASFARILSKNRYSIYQKTAVRIPKLLLEQAQLKDEVQIIAVHNALVIKPAEKPRAGWAAAFRKMAECGDDMLLDDMAPTTWDEQEWRG